CHRRVLRRAADRRARLRAQEVCASGRHRVHLRVHDPAPALAAPGPLRYQGHVTPSESRWADHPAALALARRHRPRAWEPIPWVLALAFFFAFPKYLGFGTELLITILFAISLDLVLGYAGIVTLGQAAFFGAGAYTVGILAKRGIWNEPITGLILAAVGAAAIRPRPRPPPPPPPPPTPPLPTPLP